MTKVGINSYINGGETPLRKQAASQTVNKNKPLEDIKNSNITEANIIYKDSNITETNDNIIILEQLKNYSKEKIEEYFFCSLSQVVSVATPQELKLLFSYILETYPYQSSVNTYNKKPSDVINKHVILFYTKVKSRKDFAEYIKNDPLIEFFNLITLYIEDSSQEKPSGSPGTYFRYSIKVLAAILAAKNDDSILANNLLKNTLDHFRLSIICCKNDSTNVNNIISLFMLIASSDLKSEFKEKYISQNIDIFFDTLETIDASKNIFILLLGSMAFNILEKKLFVDQTHKYLRANASKLPLQQRISFKNRINQYNAGMLAINGNLRSYQEWDITNWYLLKDCFTEDYNRNNINDKLYSEFIHLSAIIIANPDNNTNNTSYKEEIVKFFKGTVTGIILEQFERLLNSNEDRNVIDSIKKRNVDHSLHLFLKMLQRGEITRRDKINDIFEKFKYDDRSPLPPNLLNYDPDQAKQELLKLNQKDIKNFNLLRCVILLDANKKTFNLIQNSSFFSCAKGWLHFRAAQTFIADENNISLALKHINKAISLTSEEYKYISLKSIIERQIENTKIVDEDIEKNNQQFFVTETNTPKVEEKVDSSGVINHINAILAETNNKNSTSQDNKQESEQEVDQDLEYFSSLTPKQFHIYWQLEHNNRIRTINEEQTTKIWEIDGHSINSEKTIKIENKFGVTYHIYVPTKIQEALGEEWSTFEKAINKGFVRFKEGQSGIKYLNKDTVEIKVVASDTRIVGDHYIIENDHILIFDRNLSNHKGVKRELKINY